MSGRRSRSSRAGLDFPVSCIHRSLRRSNYTKRVGAGASVFLAAVLEYLTHEVLDLLANKKGLNKVMNAHAIVKNGRPFTDYE